MNTVLAKRWTQS